MTTGFVKRMRVQVLVLAAVMLSASASAYGQDQICWEVQPDGSIADWGAGGPGSVSVCAGYDPLTPLPPGTIVPHELARAGGVFVGDQVPLVTTAGKEGTTVCTASISDPAAASPGAGAHEQVWQLPNSCRVASKTTGTTKGNSSNLYRGATGTGPGAVPSSVASSGQGGAHPTADNASASKPLDMDPVNPATGDFYLYRSDFNLPGKAIDFSLTRSYHSRLDYDGPMGHAWDHSYNQRLIVTASTSCEGELLYMAGNSRTILFREVSESPSTIVYEAETPEHVTLRGHRAAVNVPVSWTLTDPSGRVSTFDSRGLLTRIEAADQFGLDFTWEAQEGPAEWRLAVVKDSVGRLIEFRYFDSGRLREVVNTTGPRGAAITGDEQLRVTYEYTPDGDLDNAIDAQGRREYYGYSAAVAPSTLEPTYIPEGYIHEACTLACQPSATSCHAGGGCDDAASKYGGMCHESVWNCPKLCSVVGDSLFGQGDWEEMGPHPDMHNSCMNQPGTGCADNCEDYCSSDAFNTQRGISCNDAWKKAKSADVGWDRDEYEETLCDKGFPKCSTTCGQRADLALQQNPNFIWKAIYDSCYSTCTTDCGIGFIDGCMYSLLQDCPVTCPSGCEDSCLKAGQLAFFDQCVRGDDADPSSKGCDIEGNLEFCDAQDWGGLCKSGCEEGCIEAARDEHAPRYGYLADLGHNLERVYNGDHELYLENTYGQVLGTPSFDAVITQRMGDRVWSLDYRDLRGEKEGAILPPTSGPAAQNVESLDDYLSYEVCPSVCVSVPHFSGTTDFVPWGGNKLLVVKGLTKPGGLTVKKATVSLPPTLLRITGSTAVSATGGAFIPAGMQIVMAVGASDVTLTASPTEPGRFDLKGKADAIQALGAYKELTFVTEAGSGIMRAYPGQPLGLTQLATGNCSTAFQATSDELGRVTLSPASACTADLLLAPLASAAEGEGYVDEYLHEGPTAFAELDLFTATVMAPARHTVGLHVTSIPGVYHQDVGPREGAPPKDLASAAWDVARTSALFSAPDPTSKTKPPIFVFHVPATIRGSGPAPILFDIARDFVMATGLLRCDRVIVGDPASGVGERGRGPKPVKATAVVDGYGARWVHYFDDKGQSIRTKNVETSANRWTNYNYFGDVTATLEPAGNRTCLTYNARGSVTQAARYPVPGALGPNTPIVQRFAYTSSLPERLETIFDPRDPTKVMTSLQWNALGHLTSSRDALGQETTYAPSAWGQPTQTKGPGVFDTYVPNPDSGLIEQVIQDSGAPTELSSLYDFDAVGRPRLAQDPFGNISSWTWQGPMLDVAAFESGSRRVELAFTYTGTADAETVDDGATLTTLAYDGFGIAQKVTRAPKSGPDPAATTCRHNGPYGRLLESIGPEGERTKYVYDGEGRLKQVIAGWWPSTSQPWEAGCVTTTTLEPTTPGGEKTVQRIDYDANGWVIGVTDARGARTDVVNDGFGRPIKVTDSSGKQRRAAYDNLDQPIWTAAYDFEGNGQPSSIPYRLPMTSDAGLMAVTQFVYDVKGRLSSEDRWHFDENRAWVGDGIAHTGYAYNEATREVTVTDDANGVLKIQSDGVGRPVKRTLPSGDVETFMYGLRDGQPTVTRTWPAPTPTGVRSETTILTPWGAPSSIVTSDAGQETTLGSFAYDARFRPLTQSSASGEVVAMTYDGLGRTKTVATSKQAGIAETVTLTYDRTDRVRTRTSQIPGGATAATSYQFDVLGRVVRVNRPTGVFEAFVYPHGSPQPSTSTDSRGMRKSYAYANNGQLRSVTVLASLMESMGTWQERRFVYDGLDRIVSATDTGDNYSSTTDDIVTTFAWDSLGGKRKEWNSLLGAAAGITTTLDGRGLPVTQVIAGRTLTRQYDALGRLADLKVDALSPSAAHLTYGGLGGPKERLYGNGVKTIFDYDALGRQVGQNDTKAGVALAKWRWPTPLDGVPRMAAFSRQGAPEVAAVFKTDGGARITNEDYGVKGAAVGAFTLAPGLATSAANQATSSLIGSGFGKGTSGFGTGAPGSGWRAYQLDARDNWKSRTAGNPALALPPIVVNALDAITSIGSATVQLDGGGNLVNDGADLKLDYNRFAQPKMIYLGVIGVRSYRYDALGRRVAETDLTTGITTLYGFDGASRTVKKQLPSGPVEITIDGDGIDEHLVRLEGTSRSYYHQDRTHSVYLVTDAAGAPAEWYEYTAQGELSILSPQGQLRATSAIGNRFGFQGQPFDLTTGMVDMRARLYRPSWGRFIMADPIGLLGGANMFAFAGGAPLAFWDPFGLDYNAYTQSGNYNPFRSWHTGPTDFELANDEAWSDVMNSTSPGEWFSGMWRFAVTTPSASVSWAVRSVINAPGDTAASIYDATASGYGASQETNIFRRMELVHDALISGTTGALQTGALVLPFTGRGAGAGGRVVTTAEADAAWQAAGSEGGAAGPLMAEGGPTIAYSRKAYGGAQTNGPAAQALRAGAEGQPCPGPSCGKPMVSNTNTKPVPEHDPALVVHYYEHGGWTLTDAQRAAYASSPEAFNGVLCLTCQRGQGGFLAKYSRYMKILWDLGGN